MAKKLCILRVILIIFSGLLLDGCTTISSKPVGIEPLKTGTLQEGGFDPGIFKSVDTILQEAIVKNVTPGAVLLVGKDNMIVYEKAYGNRRLRPHIEPMTADTIFDLASCSKVLGTSTMAMLLIQDGKLQLDTKVADVLPQFAQNEKGNVTVWNLLTHTSGLPAYCDWKEAEKLRGNKTPDDALIDYISSLKTKYQTGEYYIYSCLNFLTLARVNETIAGETTFSKAVVSVQVILSRPKLEPHHWPFEAWKLQGCPIAQGCQHFRRVHRVAVDIARHTAARAFEGFGYR